MRLAVIGPQNTGKSTFVKDFVDHFPHYKTPEKTYRDVVEKFGLKLNQDTNEEAQIIIRDFIFDQIKSFQGENVIFDRALLDNYVYSLAQYERGKMRKRFIEETKSVMYESLKHIDRIVFIPTSAGVDLVQDGIRDIDKSYIDYINRLFLQELIELARQNPTPIWFINGNRENRMKLIKENLGFSSGIPHINAKKVSKKLNIK